MVGLALAGGGVKGSYQIGAYMAFKKCHIKFDGVCGTSIGSFNAAMIAAGREEELLQVLPLFLSLFFGSIYSDCTSDTKLGTIKLVRGSGPRTILLP